MVNNDLKQISDYGGNRTEPSGERQVVLGGPNYFGRPKTQLAMFV